MRNSIREEHRKGSVSTVSWDMFGTVHKIETQQKTSCRELSQALGLAFLPMPYLGLLGSSGLYAASLSRSCNLCEVMCIY